MDSLNVQLEYSSKSVTNLDNDDDDIGTGSISQGSKGKRRRKVTSEVWKFFDILEEKFDDGKTRCKCKKCEAVFICDGRCNYGTGNLKRHSVKCLRSDKSHVGQLTVNHDVSLRSSRFDPMRFRELLISAIIMHDLPLSFVEYAGIKAVFAYLHEGISIISRNIVRADVVKLYKREKLHIKSMLEEAHGARICLTSDLWTSITTDGYISLTAHFIDTNWVLQKRILNFSPMPPPHSGVAINNKVTSLLTEWGIHARLFSITLDNASANDAFVGLLIEHLNLKGALVANGAFFHQRCCAHIVNLMVQDGLKEIYAAVEKVRDSVKYVKGSQVRKAKFLECVKLFSVDGKKGLQQDVPTRWNSTYLMLESACYYQNAFCHLALSDSNYVHCPTTLEWEKVEKIKKFLEIFFDMTNLFSGSKYPTAHLYFHATFKAYTTLKDLSEGADEDLKSMSLRMLKKFGKYWSEFSIILSIAVILDPRYKIQFVEWSYKKLYGSRSAEFKKVRDKLFLLFEEYSKEFSSGSCSSREYMQSDPAEQVQETDMYEEFDVYEGEEYPVSSSKSELDKFLYETKIGRKVELDILGYWKNNQVRYPILARMARDILSIPITTVASESAFSCGGRVLDQYRSCLKPDLVEALMCSRDWLYGLKDEFAMPVDELTENVMNLSIDDEPSVQDSTN